VAEKQGKHGAGYLDCTNCEKRVDQDIDDPLQFWKLILLYAAINYPKEYREYTWSDIYRKNRDAILAAANKYYRQRRTRA
jgi:hypothetical protein